MRVLRFLLLNKLSAMYFSVLSCCSVIYWIGSQATISSLIWKINTVEAASGERFEAGNLGRRDVKKHIEPGRRFAHVRSLDIPVGKYPFLGIFFEREERRCAGTLTTPKLSITSCHCLVKERNSPVHAPHSLIDPKTVMFLVGPVDLSHAWGVRGTPQKLGVHPECQIVIADDGFTIMYDYGVMLFKDDFPANGIVGSLSLPDFQGKSLIDEMIRGEVPCILIGWGKSDQEGNHTVLMKEDVGKLKTQEWCGTAVKEFGKKEKLPSEIKYTENDICATVVGKNKSVCQGDLGGPLLCGTAEKQLIGVVSWSPSCAIEGQPMVYNRLDIANDWINEVVEKGLSSSPRLYLFNRHVISSLASFSILKYIRFMA